MIKYVIKRLFYAIPVFLGITFTVYLLINLAPGGPLSILASSGEMSLSDLEALKASLGLDKPVLVRYFLWLADLLHGNLGTSYRTSQTVSMMIGQRIIPSLLLTGTGIIGAFLSVELQKKTPASEHKKIYVICPECANNGQMFFRENVEPMVCEKNVILLMATVTTGISIRRGMECIEYYGGNLKSVCTIFSAVADVDGIAVHNIFTADDIPGYASYQRRDCPFCKNNTPIEALVNSYGYSQL